MDGFAVLGGDPSFAGRGFTQPLVAEPIDRSEQTQPPDVRERWLTAS